MDTMQDIFADYARAYKFRKESDMWIAEFLGCRTDPMAYASAPERILAIGEPVVLVPRTTGSAASS